MKVLVGSQIVVALFMVGTAIINADYFFMILSVLCGIWCCYYLRLIWKKDEAEMV